MFRLVNSTSRFAGSTCSVRTRCAAQKRHSIYFQRNFLNARTSGKSKKRYRSFLLPATSFAVASGFAFNYWISSAESDILAITDDGLPLRYDVNLINTFWDQHPRIVLWRLKQIISSVLPFLVEVFWEHRTGKMDEERMKIRAIELKSKLTELGPAFIKLGQMLSTRPDILPQTVLFELQKLCDAVPSFPTSKAIEILKEEHGDDVLERFEDFNVDTKPIAAASLGQVYKLKLSQSKDIIALKIQRPDMIRAVSLDLYLLRKYAQFVEATKSFLMFTGILSKRQQFDVELIDCFANGSYAELDYCNEARNQQMFQDELVPRLNDKVKVPKVYNNFTSRKVLATEWIDGIQLAKSSSEVIQKLVPVGVECFLIQLLQWGVFHCDPHAHSFRLVDNEGKLVLIDFGLCAEVPRPDTKTMTEAVVHLMEGDVEGLLEDAINLSFLPRDVDKEGLLTDLHKVFEESKIKAIEHTSDYRAVESRRKKFKEVSKDLNSVFYRYPFLVPDYFALITRALIVLEGIAVKGNPSFDIFKAAYPFAFQYSIQTLGAKDAVTLGNALVNNGLTNQIDKGSYFKGFFSRIFGN